ncbi:eukaryotic translation initiation factor NCBP [Drosophila yakuba]|uniref:eukaryotic translation initiation factor NCBP n=1 Tax=Drosophila yakuba TaxID=7245 RepID=UPI0019308A85|nr:eukaryotic translation initiation factor NCBP [Drosophila yakuba]XP_015045361.2 eukaryotic translation initiation factor NCBP [Drosophila yakuba]XP_015045362.2 eukaryotic translation initiation factor NCBP [Drosophila yakuba]
MFPNNFYKMKNFANPKTMFKSCSSNDDYPTQGLQKVAPSTDVTPTAAAPQSAAVPQSTAQPAKTQEPKNAPKKTTPPEPPKQGQSSKKNKKGKKNQKNAPRTPSQTSRSSESHKESRKNQPKDAKSTGKEDKEKVKGQAKEKEKVLQKERGLEQKKVQEQSSIVAQDKKNVVEKKLQDKKSVEKKGQEKVVPEQKYLEQRIEKQLSEQKLLDRRLEPRIYQSVYPQVKEEEAVVAFADSPDYLSLSEASEEELTTGAEDDESVEPEEPQHPLNSCWTLWYLENDRTKSWEDMLHEVTSFDTVENFWSLITHIKPPSELKVGSDYCMFKKGVRPMWEDEANVHGGRWVINLNKNTKLDLDNFWMDSMLCLIGEACEHADTLCGVVVNIRGKTNKISIWTADGGNEAAVLEIGRVLREGLRMDSVYVLKYQLHNDTKVKQGSTVKSIYTL